MTRDELLQKEEAVMQAVCELCRWPLDFSEDEEVLNEEHCNHCPAALAVDDLCKSLQTERSTVTNMTRLISLSPEELAREIFDNLAQFPSCDTLLAWLQQEATL